MVFNKIMLHAFHLRKLKLSFKGSIYELSELCVHIFIGIFGFLFIGYFGAIYAFTYKDETESCKDIKYLYIIPVIYAGIDIIIVTVMTYMFTKRLYGVLSISMSAEMYKVARKVTSLCIISIISNIIFIIVSTLLSKYISSYAIYGFDLISTNMVILLQFHKSNKLYVLLCHCNNQNIPKNLNMSIVNSHSIRIQPPTAPNTPDIRQKSNSNPKINRQVSETDDGIGDIITSPSEPNKITRDNDSIVTFVSNLTNTPSKVPVHSDPETDTRRTTVTSPKDNKLTIKVAPDTDDFDNNLENKKKITPKLCKERFKELGIIM